MAIRTFDHAVIYMGVWYKAHTPIDFRDEEVCSEDTCKAAPADLAGAAEKPKRAPRKKKEA